MPRNICRIKTLTLFLLLFSFALYAQEIIQKGNSYYISNTLVVKFKNGYAGQQAVLQSFLKKNFSPFEARNVIQMFPAAGVQLNKGEETLSNIYQLEYRSLDDPITLSTRISKSPEIEYAEPKYVHRIVHTPNDSLFQAGEQNHLNKIYAPQAWDVTKGDTSVLVAIVDTGVEWDHPDLSANILKDGSEKVIGYDFGGLNGLPDDNPREDIAPNNRNAYHGTHVAGIAAAATNNKIGVASIGYNCTILPVKASRSDKRDANGAPFIYYGFEAIKYAADKGAKVINCSWGGYSYSRYEQEIIDYATSKGALVVAAAGNENKIDPFYPASYRGVFSVAWGNNDDTKFSQGNYGRAIDAMAPGTFIWSTWPKLPPNNKYYQMASGSSMSAPLVSGLAGLVAAKFPNYTPLQIAEQIRVTSDNVYSVNEDSLKYLLGKGRINAFRAVSETNTISVRATDIKYADKGNGNGLFETGEEIEVSISLTNYLSKAENINVSAETADKSIVVSLLTGNVVSIDSKQTLMNGYIFKFAILQGAPYNHEVHFLLKFSSGTYSDFQWFSVRVNPTYDTHDANKITMSVTSKGALGFNDYPENREGIGFKYDNGDNLLFEGAFIYGTASNKVMDAARITDKQSADFVMLQPIKIASDPIGNQTGKTIFNDNGAGANALGIETKLNSYSFERTPNDKFVILEAELKNKSMQNIGNFYAGYFFDWDIPADDPNIDTTAYDTAENFGYAYCKDVSKENTIVGAALISSDKYGYYPIDNSATSGDVRLFDADGYTDGEKWLSISSGIVKEKVPVSDISFVVSGGPYSIHANESIKIAFSIAAGKELNDLRNSIKQSRNKYIDIYTNISEEKNLPTEFLLYQNYPNPFNPSTTIKYQIAVTSKVQLKVCDLLGRDLVTLVDELKQPGIYNSQFSIRNYQLPSGVYFYTLRAGNFSQTKKMILLK